MTQSRFKSFEEALLNVGVGFIIGMILNLVALPMLLDIPFEAVSLENAVYISLLYGSISILRSFILRRLYNNRRRRRWIFW